MGRLEHRVFVRGDGRGDMVVVDGGCRMPAEPHHREAA